MYNGRMNIKNGDIITVSGNGFVSGMINIGTFALPGRGASHIGIVCKHNNDPLVYESTSMGRAPCHLQKRVVSGAQAHLLEDYVKFVDGAVWHYPLRRALYNHEIVRLSRTLDRSLGLPYDFLGAFRSGGYLFRTLQACLREEDLSSLFCSEWVADSLVQTGILHAKSASSWNPNRLIRYLLRTGTVGKPRKLN